MKAIFYVVVLVFFFSRNSMSQSLTNDQGNTDTLCLFVTASPSDNSSSTVIVEAWVYSDETILSFSAGFKWSNPDMHLDSAKAAQLLTSSQCGLYLYHFDHPDSSNRLQIFQLGGLSYALGIPGDSNAKRHWVTYYFTINNWNDRDSIRIDLLPSSEIEFSFVTNGPTYPLGFQPYFSGPVLFPGIVTSIDDADISLPSEFALHQNFPNPFNPETTIEFELPKSSQVSLIIYNTLGQHVRTLANRKLTAGQHSFKWDSKTENGALVPSGIYFYKFSTPDYSVSKKMALVR